jgi:hypothetical protein
LLFIKKVSKIEPRGESVFTRQIDSVIVISKKGPNR